MQNEWIEIAPGYSINEEGYVRNDHTKRVLKRSFMENGEPAVSLRVDGHLYRRQVISYMAETWMEPHENELFNIPMHLDGDRENCHAYNLIFRPKWFVRAYHKECVEDPFPEWDRPFRLVETGEVFDHPRDCAQRYGFLQRDIMLSIFREDSYIFPGRFKAEWL